MDHEDPLVSVIIPVFNRPARVREAVESALDQEYPHIEVVIVDDGSTDDTRTTVRALGSERPEVVPILLEENLGPSAARNRAVAEASGSLVSFLDSDDLMLPGRIRSGVDALLASPDHAAAAGRLELWVADGVTVPPMIEKERETIADQPSIMTSMVRRATYVAMGGFDEALRFSEDVDFHYRLGPEGGVLYIDELWTVRRVFGDNLVYDSQGIREGMFAMMRKHRDSSNSIG